jgi:predicted RNA-binding protein YlxR (DUF448 family)
MPKHVPVRQCVACRQAKPKRELIRAVIARDGTVTLDPGGKKPGRGAYVCRIRQCLELAIRGHKLDRSLKHKVDEGTLAALIAEMEALPPSDEPEPNP